MAFVETRQREQDADLSIQGFRALFRLDQQAELMKKSQTSGALFISEKKNDTAPLWPSENAFAHWMSNFYLHGYNQLCKITQFSPEAKYISII